MLLIPVAKMKKHSFVCAVLGAALLNICAVSIAAEPTLTSAWLETTTDDDDRDHDTCINVEARTHDTHKLIAASYVFACDGQFGNADHTFGVDNIPIVNGPWTKSDIQNFDFRMGITPHGSDTWKFSAWFHFCFSDHSALDSVKWSQKIDANVGGRFPAPVFNHKGKPVLFQLDWSNDHDHPSPEPRCS